MDVLQHDIVFAGVDAAKYALEAEAVTANPVAALAGRTHRRHPRRLAA